MIERLVITIVLAVIGMAAYQGWKRLQLNQAAARPLNLMRFPINQGIPAVVLFTADYCAPCKFQQQPAIERLLHEIGADRLQFIKIDVAAEPDLAAQWGVLSLPTTYILDAQGQPRDVNYGVTSTDILKRQLDAIA